MLRKIFFLFLITLAIGATVAGFILGKNVSFAKQWPLFEALRNTAAIIFAVVGAWLAIIFPERLKISFGKESKDSTNSNGSGMGLLLAPAVHSTILLVVLLLIGVTAPLLKQIPEIMENVKIFRGISFSVLVALTLWQATIVVMTLFPAELVLSTSQREKAAAKIQNRFGRLRR